MDQEFPELSLARPDSSSHQSSSHSFEESGDHLCSISEQGGIGSRVMLINTGSEIKISKVVAPCKKPLCFLLKA